MGDKQALLALASTVKSGVLLPASITSIFVGVELALKLKVTCSEAGFAPTASAPNWAALKETSATSP